MNVMSIAWYNASRLVSILSSLWAYQGGRYNTCIIDIKTNRAEFYNMEIYFDIMNLGPNTKFVVWDD
jgi:hypothetical protein